MVPPTTQGTDGMDDAPSSVPSSLDDAGPQRNLPGSDGAPDSSLAGAIASDAMGASQAQNGSPAAPHASDADDDTDSSSLFSKSVDESKLEDHPDEDISDPKDSERKDVAAAEDRSDDADIPYQHHLQHHRDNLQGIIDRVEAAKASEPPNAPASGAQTGSTGHDNLAAAGSATDAPVSRVEDTSENNKADATDNMDVDDGDVADGSGIKQKNVQAPPAPQQAVRPLSFKTGPQQSLPSLQPSSWQTQQTFGVASDTGPFTFSLPSQSPAKSATIGSNSSLSLMTGSSAKPGWLFKELSSGDAARSDASPFPTLNFASEPPTTLRFGASPSVGPQTSSAMETEVADDAMQDAPSVPAAATNEAKTMDAELPDAPAIIAPSQPAQVATETADSDMKDVGDSQLVSSSTANSNGTTISLLSFGQTSSALNNADKKGYFSQPAFKFDLSPLPASQAQPSGISSLRLANSSDVPPSGLPGLSTPQGDSLAQPSQFSFGSAAASNPGALFTGLPPAATGGAPIPAFPLVSNTVQTPVLDTMTQVNEAVIEDEVFRYYLHDSFPKSLVCFFAGDRARSAFGACIASWNEQAGDIYGRISYEDCLKEWQTNKDLPNWEVRVRARFVDNDLSLGYYVEEVVNLTIAVKLTETKLVARFAVLSGNANQYARWLNREFDADDDDRKQVIVWIQQSSPSSPWFAIADHLVPLVSKNQQTIDPNLTGSGTGGDSTSHGPNNGSSGTSDGSGGASAANGSAGDSSNTVFGAGNAFDSGNSNTYGFSNSFFGNIHAAGVGGDVGTQPNTMKAEGVLPKEELVGEIPPCCWRW